MNKGFNQQEFMEYLEKALNGFDKPYFRNLVENLIDYGLKHEHVSKDQFCYWLSDLLPEIQFGEVAAFMSDNCLTENGIQEKKDATNDFQIDILEAN